MLCNKRLQLCYHTVFYLYFYIFLFDIAQRTFSSITLSALGCRPLLGIFYSKRERSEIRTRIGLKKPFSPTIKNFIAHGSSFYILLSSFAAPFSPYISFNSYALQCYRLFSFCSYLGISITAFPDIGL